MPFLPRIKSAKSSFIELNMTPSVTIDVTLLWLTLSFLNLAAAFKGTNVGENFNQVFESDLNILIAIDSGISIKKKKKKKY